MIIKLWLNLTQKYNNKKNINNSDIKRPHDHPIIPEQLPAHFYPGKKKDWFPETNCNKKINSSFKV